MFNTPGLYRKTRYSPFYFFNLFFLQNNRTNFVQKSFSLTFADFYDTIRYIIECGRQPGK